MNELANLDSSNETSLVLMNETSLSRLILFFLMINLELKDS